MELDLSRLSWPILIATLLAILIALAVFGAMVTTAQGGEPILISPERWTAARLARQAQAEAQALMHDASQLRNLLEADQPDPVAAMLLAQRLYAITSTELSTGLLTRWQARRLGHALQNYLLAWQTVHFE
jgi:hypothetical protein